MASLATAYVNHSGWTLYYGDAEAHLNIARRIVDSRRPGYDQIGTVWLPLPHLLTLAIRAEQSAYGAADWLALFLHRPASFAPVFSCMPPSNARPNRHAARLASLGLLVFNPNLLYLQATPMTEAVFLAALMALLYFTIVFRETQSLAAVIGAGVASIAASLARYEGWFLIPFVALYFLFAARKNKLRRRGGFLGDCGSCSAVLAGAQLVDLFQSVGILQRAIFGDEHLPASARAKHGALSRAITIGGQRRSITSRP